MVKAVSLEYFVRFRGGTGWVLISAKREPSEKKYFWPSRILAPFTGSVAEIPCLTYGVKRACIFLWSVRRPGFWEKSNGL